MLQIYSSPSLATILVSCTKLVARGSPVNTSTEIHRILSSESLLVSRKQEGSIASQVAIMIGEVPQKSFKKRIENNTLSWSIFLLQYFEDVLVVFENLRAQRYSERVWKVPGTFW